MATLYIVAGRIQAKRLQILRASAIRNNYSIRDTITDDVTHILTEFDTVEQVLRALTLDQFPTNVVIVNCQWLIDSIKRGEPIADEESLQKYVKKREPSPISKSDNSPIKFNAKEFPSLVCQRKCLVNHHNRHLVKDLEILVQHAEYRDDEADHDYTRALAFCKAISVLKSIPFRINQVEQLERLPDIGPHSMRVMKEILEDGECSEVVEIANSQWFKSMNAFNAVYGIGPATAKKLYIMGMKTIDDLRENKSLTVKGEDRISFGLAFYEDLNQAVTIEEAERMKSIIAEETLKIDERIKIDLTGGFGRQKTTGHDIDLLFTHPEEGKEIGFLAKLLRRLSDASLILHNTYKPKTDEEKHDTNSTLDHFEQALLILKLPCDSSRDESLLHSHPTACTYDTLRMMALQPDRAWRAVRVDLVVCPVAQHAYALLGWTGSKLFNRSIRNYAKKRLNKKLTSHGMWDYTLQKHITASTEKEVFNILNLKYIKAYERNA